MVKGLLVGFNMSVTIHNVLLSLDKAKLLGKNSNCFAVFALPVKDNATSAINGRSISIKRSNKKDYLTARNAT